MSTDPHSGDPVKKHRCGFCEREAIRVARHPKIYFWTSFGISLIFGIVGLTQTDLSNSDHTGWNSRGSTIANRQTQIMIARKHAKELLRDTDGTVWEDLIENVQPGWETNNNVARGIDSDDFKRRKLLQASAGEEGTIREFPTVNSNWMTRRLQEELNENDSSNITLTSQLAQCDISWYSDGRMTNGTRLWPNWKAKNSGTSFLDGPLLEELCLAEENTQRFLEENDLCTGCPGLPNKCLPPFSLVLMARLTVKKGMDMSCPQLAEAWKDYSHDMANDFQKCAQDLKYTPKSLKQLEKDGMPDSCPFGFSPSVADEGVADTRLVTRTSSLFATKEDADVIHKLYQSVSEFDKGGEHIEGAYDTQYQDFVTMLADEAVGGDMILATASVIITTMAMLIHTRSPFLTLAGVLQIGLSFPVSLFIYSNVIGLNFFPFLNFIGVFVLFALGSDDVFVAVDKWKNYRNTHPEATTEQVAAYALPDAAQAMFLTTSTTSVAFFSTAISPVVPIRVFAIFLGLLIFIDYLLCILILFPCLCIYDGYRDAPRGRFNWCISFQWHSCKEDDAEGARGRRDTALSLEDDSDLRGVRSDELNETNSSASAQEKPSLIRRILLSYYDILCRIRWPLFVCCMVAFGFSAYFAAQMDTPESTEVRVLQPHEEFEKCHAWRMELLSATLYKKEGSKAYVIWGVLPADTGDLNDPGTWSQMVLDEKFDASSREAQEYLVGFCDHMYEHEFAEIPDPGFICPINQFDAWLQNQANETNPEEIWVSHCDGAAGLPMNPSTFNDCVSAWAVKTGERSILSYKGKVQIIFVPFESRVQYFSPKDTLQAEWDMIDAWMTHENEGAPETVSNAFFASQTFWYYDTTKQMYSTAVGSVAISLAAAAVVVVFTSKSLAITVLSVLSVTYVLASIVSMALAAGWSLGFLEGICFAIAIGISVDFVVHFSHSYTTPVGKVGREERTRFALIEMGPSILAAGFTTIAGAATMFFCTIDFFTLFATILLFTIIQATLGSFVFFFTLTTCIGPSQPTYFVDRISAWWYSEEGDTVVQDTTDRNKDGERAGFDSISSDTPEKSEGSPWVVDGPMITEIEV